MHHCHLTTQSWFRMYTFKPKLDISYSVAMQIKEQSHSCATVKCWSVLIGLRYKRRVAHWWKRSTLRRAVISYMSHLSISLLNGSFCFPFTHTLTLEGSSRTHTQTVGIPSLFKAHSISSLFTARSHLHRGSAGWQDSLCTTPSTGCRRLQPDQTQSIYRLKTAGFGRGQGHGGGQNTSNEAAAQ